MEREGEKRNRPGLTAVERFAFRHGDEGRGRPDRQGHPLRAEPSEERGGGCEEVPVHVARELTPDQIRAYRIADNRTAEEAEWNLELLRIELGDLDAKEYDVALTGFDLQEINQLLVRQLSPGKTDPDHVPTPPAEPATRPGDLWILGDERKGHRLLCGDRAAAADLDRLLEGAPAHLLNTDPPYNVKVEPRSNNAIAAGLSSFTSERKMHHQKLDVSRHPSKPRATSRQLRAKDRPLTNDFASDAAFRKLLLAWFWNAGRVLAPGRSFYVWGGYSNCVNIPLALQTVGLYVSQAIIWVKEHPVLTRKDFMGNHEWCFYGWREGAHVFFEHRRDQPAADALRPGAGRGERRQRGGHGLHGEALHAEGVP